MKVLFIKMSRFKLYTKTGDKGTTNLYDMSRVGKHEHIFEVLGDIDELSAYIGVVLALDKNELYESFLRKLQSKLLDIGSDIATIKHRKKIIEIGENDITEIENFIDKLQDMAPPLKEFILPGLNPLDANIHVCRTITRRLERHLCKLKIDNESHPTGNLTYVYINRLSDFFFALARAITGGREYTRSQAQDKF